MYDTDTYFVIYVPKNMMFFADEAPFYNIWEAGYHLVAFIPPQGIMFGMKKLYEGSLIQCRIIHDALISFGRN